MLYFDIVHHSDKPADARRETCRNFFKKTGGPAQNPTLDTCADLINFIENIIRSRAFPEQSRKNKGGGLNPLIRRFPNIDRS